MSRCCATLAGLRSSLKVPNMPLSRDVPSRLRKAAFLRQVEMAELRALGAPLASQEFVGDEPSRLAAALANAGGSGTYNSVDLGASLASLAAGDDGSEPPEMFSQRPDFTGHADLPMELLMVRSYLRPASADLPTTCSVPTACRCPLLPVFCLFVHVFLSTRRATHHTHRLRIG